MDGRLSARYTAAVVLLWLLSSTVLTALKHVDAHLTLRLGGSPLIDPREPRLERGLADDRQHAPRQRTLGEKSDDLDVRRHRAGRDEARGLARSEIAER